MISVCRILEGAFRPGPAEAGAGGPSSASRL